MPVESDPGGNGRLVGVTEAAAVLGLPRRTLGGRLARGQWPTAGWRQGRGGQQRLVDLAVLGDLLGRNGGPAGRAAGQQEHNPGDPCVPAAQGLVASLVDDVARQLQARGLRELAEARSLVGRTARALADLNAERLELERARADLAAQRAAVRKLAADHATARDAYRTREAELAQQLVRLGRQRHPRPGEAHYSD